jgi:cysteine desulfurase
MMRQVYLDNSATTPLDPRVKTAMEPFQDEIFGNPSSMHNFGRVAKEAVEKARRQAADLLCAQPTEIVFTGSGTEADNLAIIGSVLAQKRSGAHIIFSAIEHPAVSATCQWLVGTGCQISKLPVSSEGIVDPDDLDGLIRPETVLVSVMAANNVIGTLQPIAEIGTICRQHGILFHTDAVQAAGKIPLDVSRMPIDLLSISGHKFHGPKGVGALYIRSGIKLAPIMHGGGQEQGLRSATENVSGIAGLGCAAEICRQEMADEAMRLFNLREEIIEGCLANIPGCYLIGHRYQRLPGHICFGFRGREGDAMKLLLALDGEGIAVSSGSACSAHKVGEPSGILVALGFDTIKARGSLRITLGRFNTTEDVKILLGVLPQVVMDLNTITSKL